MNFSTTLGLCDLQWISDAADCRDLALQQMWGKISKLDTSRPFIIAVFGGSVTHGIPYIQASETYCETLAKTYFNRQLLGRSAVCLNFGIPAMGSGEPAICFKNIVSSKWAKLCKNHTGLHCDKPVFDIVVFEFSINSVHYLDVLMAQAGSHGNPVLIYLDHFPLRRFQHSENDNSKWIKGVKQRDSACSGTHILNSSVLGVFPFTFISEKAAISEHYRNIQALTHVDDDTLVPRLRYERFWYDDNLHLSATGHEMVAELIYAFLDESRQNRGRKATMSKCSNIFTTHAVFVSTCLTVPELIKFGSLNGTFRLDYIRFDKPTLYAPNIEDSVGAAYWLNVWCSQPVEPVFFFMKNGGPPQAAYGPFEVSYDQDQVHVIHETWEAGYRFHTKRFTRLTGAALAPRVYHAIHVRILQARTGGSGGIGMRLCAIAFALSTTGARLNQALTCVISPRDQALIKTSDYLDNLDDGND